MNKIQWSSFAAGKVFEWDVSIIVGQHDILQTKSTGQEEKWPDQISCQKKIFSIGVWKRCRYDVFAKCCLYRSIKWIQVFDLKYMYLLYF